MTRNGKSKDDLVDNFAEAESNARRFLGVGNERSSVAYEQLGKYFHWHFFPNLNSFAPSKFIGYRDTTLGNYASKGTGSDTRARLSKLFRKLEPEERIYKALLPQLRKFVASADKSLSIKTTAGTGGIYIPIGADAKIIEKFGPKSTDYPSARYWRVVDAVRSLGDATLAEVEAWLEKRYRGDPLGNTRADLEHLTVNSPSRPHYDKTRTDWRSNQGHRRDQLFKVSYAQRARATRYTLFNPRIHGHFNLVKDAAGKWESLAMQLREDAQAEAQAVFDSFAYPDPIEDEHDARVRLMCAVVQRRGQPQFRAQLMDAYGGRCAISDCDTSHVLEAAHILPYRGEHTDRVDNGLLLRADLHTLFDCGLLWIDSNGRVRLAPAISSPEYTQLEGRRVRLPRIAAYHPKSEHLSAHEKRCHEITQIAQNKGPV